MVHLARPWEASFIRPQPFCSTATLPFLSLPANLPQVGQSFLCTGNDNILLCINSSGSHFSWIP